MHSLERALRRSLEMRIIRTKGNPKYSVYLGFNHKSAKSSRASSTDAKNVDQEENRRLRKLLQDCERDFSHLPEVIKDRHEEREWRREEARNKAHSEEARYKAEEQRQRVNETRKRLEELKYKVPMAWIGAIMTIVPIMWTLRGEQERYSKMIAQWRYENERKEENQKQSILDSFTHFAPSGLPEEHQMMARPDVMVELEDAILKLNGQIVILEGPSGVGKSTLVKKLLADAILTQKLWVVHYDLRGEYAPATPEQFLYGLLRTVGYVIDPPGTDDFLNNKERGLCLLTSLLAQARSTGARPLIVFDNIDTISNLLKRPDGNVKVVMNKILALANADLLTVVVTVNAATSKLHLDNVVPGWRSRRSIYHISSSGAYQVLKQYIDKINLLEKDPANFISEEDAVLLHENVGLSVNDLVTIISAYKSTGRSISDLIHAKVIEEDHHINELMGYVEEPHIELEKSQLKMMGHYLRLWSIMHKLVHSPKEGGRISEKELTPFPEDEINWCIENNLILTERVWNQSFDYGYSVIAERPLVRQGMKMYINSPTARLRKDELLLKYATIHKERLFERRRALEDIPERDQELASKRIFQVQLEQIDAALEELTETQISCRKRLTKLRNTLPFDHVELARDA